MSTGEVVVLGATGQIGIFAVPELSVRSGRVVAVARGGRPSWIAERRGVDWVRSIEEMGSAAPAADALLSAGPLALALEALPEMPRVRTVVAFSTSSVISKRDSPDARERRQIELIVAAEGALRHLCRKRRITCILLRPTLVYGCGMDRNISLLARWIRKFGFMPLAGAAPGLRQPVHAADLAQAAIAALELEVLEADLVSPLCGGSTLSYREMVMRIFTAMGRQPRLLSMPPALLASCLALTRHVPGIPAVSPEMVRRQAVDLVFDDSPARARLGIRPRPFRPTRADFGLPPPDGTQAA